jgi:hypothetical protein
MENMRHHVFSFHEKMTFYFTYTPSNSEVPLVFANNMNSSKSSGLIAKEDTHF